MRSHAEFIEIRLPRYDCAGGEELVYDCGVVRWFVRAQARRTAGRGKGGRGDVVFDCDCVVAEGSIVDGGDGGGRLGDEGV